LRHIGNDFHFFDHGRVQERQPPPRSPRNFSVMIHETADTDINAALTGCNGNGLEILKIVTDIAVVCSVVADRIETPLNRCRAEPPAKAPELVEPFVQVWHSRFEKP
jgi:hypothetical protein